MAKTMGMEVYLVRYGNGAPGGDDHVGFMFHELGHDLCKAFGACFRPPIIYHDIETL